MTQIHFLLFFGILVSCPAPKAPSRTVYQFDRSVSLIMPSREIEWLHIANVRLKEHCNTKMSKLSVNKFGSYIVFRLLSYYDNSFC